MFFSVHLVDVLFLICKFFLYFRVWVTDLRELELSLIAKAWGTLWGVIRFKGFWLQVLIFHLMSLSRWCQARPSRPCQLGDWCPLIHLKCRLYQSRQALLVVRLALSNPIWGLVCVGLASAFYTYLMEGRGEVCEMLDMLLFGLI